MDRNAQIAFCDESTSGLEIDLAIRAQGRNCGSLPQAGVLPLQSAAKRDSCLLVLIDLILDVSCRGALLVQWAYLGIEKHSTFHRRDDTSHQAFNHGHLVFGLCLRRDSLGQ